MAVKQVVDVDLGLPGEITSVDQALNAFGGALDRLDADPELRSKVGIKVIGNPITVKTVPDAPEWVGDWKKGVSDNADKWLRKMSTPSRNPKEAALAAKEKHKRRTEEALKEDRYAKGIAAYDLDDAIATATAVGASGYAAGAAARENKMMKKVEKMRPMVAALKETVDRMPSDTIDQAIAKSAATIKGMREIGNRLRS